MGQRKCDKPAARRHCAVLCGSFGGIVVNAEIFGLPDNAAAAGANGRSMGSSRFYAMHIHENGDCRLPFDRSGNHYNPSGAMHPQHAGDLPPLLSNNGYAWLAFYDGRLSVEEILNRSVVIHAGRDDFTSQPAGDSGDKIGCGVIEAAAYS